MKRGLLLSVMLLVMLSAETASAATLTLAPTSRPAGTSIAAKGRGFTPGITGGTIKVEGKVVTSSFTHNTGRFHKAFKAPALPNPSYQVVARDRRGVRAQSTFTRTGQPPPTGYITVPPDGGADYYAQFSNPLPASASFFPISVWGAYNHSDANIAIDKSVGLNGYVWFADASTPGALQNAREAGMWAITDKNSANSLLGSETLGRLTEDEFDMRCGPHPECYSQLENTISSLPDDGRMVYANYGKGVLLWETQAEASRFVNGANSFGEYQNFLSTDLYWFTDPNQRNMQPTPWLPEGRNGEVTMTRNQVERASNYGYQIEYLRKLDALDGVRQPIWQFVEVGCPWSECAGDFDAIKPAEIRAAVWQSLIAGARGIIYFQHTFAGPSGCVTHHALREPLACYGAVQQAVTALNAQIKSLAPVLNAPTVISGLGASGSVRATGKLHDGRLYIFAGSAANVSSTATFTVASGTTAEVVGEGRSIPIRNRSFTDAFADGNAVHIYRITPPDNSFSLGKVKRNLRKGTAKLTVKVPGPGELALTKTKRVRKDSDQVPVGGKVRLKARPRPKAKRKLADTGKLKVSLHVTYTPTGGESNIESKKVKLKRR